MFFSHKLLSLFIKKCENKIKIEICFKNQKVAIFFDNPVKEYKKQFSFKWKPFNLSSFFV